MAIAMVCRDFLPFYTPWHPLSLPFSTPRLHLCSSLRLRTARRAHAASFDPISKPSPNLPSLSTDQLKECLRERLQGLNRGVFGVPLSRKVQVEQLIELLERRNPLPRPTANLEKVKGEWRLLYSTISILGWKRTKLGLRDFITLGDVVQSIHVDQVQAIIFSTRWIISDSCDVKSQNKAINTVTFSVSGFSALSGALTIEASYNPSSATRVDICFEKSSIVPDQLLKLFQKNYDLLLSIFNPEGWLEITYVDDNMRIGRDGKGNIFVLEKISKDFS